MKLGLWIAIGILIIAIPVVLFVDDIFPVTSSMVVMAEGEDCSGDVVSGVVIAQDDKGYYVLTSGEVGDNGDDVFMFESKNGKYIAVQEMDLREYGVVLYKIIGTPSNISPIIINTKDTVLKDSYLDFYGYKTEGYLDNLNIVVNEYLLGKENVYIANTGVKEGANVIEYNGDFKYGMLGGALVDNSERLVAINIGLNSAEAYDCRALNINQILPYLQANDIPVKTGMSKQSIVLIPIVLLILLLGALQAYLMLGLSSYKIVGTTGQYAKQSIELNKRSSLVFGRDPDQCHIVFLNNAENISRKHCEIYYDRKAKRFMLVDYSSTGTLIESERMKQNKPYVLGDGLVFSLVSSAQSFKVEKK